MRGPTESSQAADSDAACTVGLLRTVSGAVSSDATAIHGIAPAGTVQMHTVFLTHQNVDSGHHHHHHHIEIYSAPITCRT